MDQMVVAVRYADLLGDILELAGQSPSKHQSFQPEGGSTQDISASVSSDIQIETQGHDAVTVGGNFARSLQVTPTTQQPQHSALSRDDVLASLMTQDSINNFETPPDDMIFGVSEGWNVVGNVFSDFTFTGENNDAALWDWEHN